MDGKIKKSQSRGKRILSTFLSIGQCLSMGLIYFQGPWIPDWRDSDCFDTFLGHGQQLPTFLTGTSEGSVEGSMSSGMPRMMFSSLGSMETSFGFSCVEAFSVSQITSSSHLGKQRSKLTSVKKKILVLDLKHRQIIMKRESKSIVKSGFQ